MVDSSHLKILFIGDVFGEPGRKAVHSFLPVCQQKYHPDLVIANCENAANGRGISSRLAKELLGYGIDCITSGNHIFRVDEVYSYLNQPDTRVLRPCNYSPKAPGRGGLVIDSPQGVKVGVINLMGQVFMDAKVDLPFDAIDRAIEQLQSEADILVLDMHAETTSEKRAMAWYVDGRVQLMVGTHTHVQTADEEILDNGTAYITDIGMTGPYHSVIGMDKDLILRRCCTALSQKFEIGAGDVRFCAVFCEIDVNAKRAIRIERVCERVSERN